MKWFLTLLKIGNDVQQKGWYASKTVWFNILSLIAALAALKGFNLNAEDIVTLAAGISTVGNIFLRFATETPIGSKTVPAEVPTVTEAVDNSTTNTDKPFDTRTIMG
jgi:hypothetical protein